MSLEHSQMVFARKMVKQPYFGFIRDGLKLKEGRALSFANGSIWNSDLIGKVLEIYSEVPTDPVFHVEITGVSIYEGETLKLAIGKMLLAEGVSKMLPDVTDEELERGVDLYLGFNQNNLHLKQMGAFSVRVLKN